MNTPTGRHLAAAARNGSSGGEQDPSVECEPPEVPGFQLTARSADDGRGEEWRAVDLVGRQEVVLRLPTLRVASTGPPAAPVRVSGSEHPHLVRLRAFKVAADGRRVLVLDQTPGGDLVELLRRRGPLNPAELSTLLVPLAQALGQLHRSGQAHGDLAPVTVRFDAAGRPLLSSPGAARLLGLPGTFPVEAGFRDPAADRGVDPRASDVWGLAAVGWFALTGRPPGATGELPPAGSLRNPALTGLLRECLAEDPAARPEPPEVATRAWMAARPVPIRLAGVQPPPGPRPLPVATRPRFGPVRPPAVVPAPARHGPRRRWVPLGVVAAVVLLFATAFSSAHPARPGWPGRHGWPGSAAGAAIRSAGLDAASAQRVVAEVAGDRAVALSAASLEALHRVDVPGSPAWRQDASLIDRLSASGSRLTGLTYRVRAARPFGRQHGRVLVRVSVDTSPHARVDRAGRRLSTVTAWQHAEVTLELAGSASSGWLVYDVR